MGKEGRQGEQQAGRAPTPCRYPWELRGSGRGHCAVPKSEGEQQTELAVTRTSPAAGQQRGRDARAHTSQLPQAAPGPGRSPPALPQAFPGSAWTVSSRECHKSLQPGGKAAQNQAQRMQAGFWEVGAECRGPGLATTVLTAHARLAEADRSHVGRGTNHPAPASSAPNPRCLPDPPSSTSRRRRGPHCAEICTGTGTPQPGCPRATRVPPRALARPPTMKNAAPFPHLPQLLGAGPPKSPATASPSAPARRFGTARPP